MQFGIEYIENFLATMVLGEKKHLEETQIWKNSFPSLSTWELTKQIVVWNYPKEALYNWMIYKVCLIKITFNASLSLDFVSNGSRLMYVHATFGYQI
jgi:hypothetical protein